MINWFNMPAEGLSNGGEFEIKELTATENKVYETPGEVYNKVTVNVEGGGGSSDFSMAEVEITGVAEIYGAFIRGDGSYYTNTAQTVTIILYKGKATLMSTRAPESVTGNISYDSDREEFTVTGDGTITFGGGLGL